MHGRSWSVGVALYLLARVGDECRPAVVLLQRLGIANEDKRRPGAGRQGASKFGRGQKSWGQVWSSSAIGYFCTAAQHLGRRPSYAAPTP